VRCLVTGASGFLGQHLVDFLSAKGHQVWVIVHDVDVRRPLEREHVVRGSIEDLACCERAVMQSQPEAVFHLAAQAIVPHARRNPLATLETNVRGTYNMLEAFRRHRTDPSTMDVASSDKAYGEFRPVDGQTGYEESDPLRGRGPYDVSKSCADLISQSYAHEFDLPIGIVRAGNIYGPCDMDMTRIVPSIASAIARNRNPVLTSDGSPVRDYLHVSDAVWAYFRVWDFISGYPGFRGEAYNFSGGEPISVLDLTNMALEAVHKTGVLVPQVLGTRKGEIQRQVLDSEKARVMLNWSPRVGLREGLEGTIDWWRKNGPDHL
jgi:CDP-glucose 4,6-dehydratase